MYVNLPLLFTYFTLLFTSTGKLIDSTPAHGSLRVNDDDDDEAFSRHDRRTDTREKNSCALSRCVISGAARSRAIISSPIKSAGILVRFPKLNQSVKMSQEQ